MFSPIIILFLILSCFNKNIYTRPIDEDKNDNSETNYNLVIFIIIVALFILACIIYYTKELWYNAIKCCFNKKKEVKSSDFDMDTSDQIFKDIDFESIHFTEVTGNSRLSIDVVEFMQKFLNNDKDDEKSYFIETGSMSQSNISKLDSKTLIKLNNVYLSPNTDDYDISEYELSPIKSQDITDTKLYQSNTSFIENSISLLNDKSNSVPEHILEDVSGIDFKSLEYKDSDIKEKKSVTSKKSKESQKIGSDGSKKEVNESENNEETNDDSSKNSGIKISNEKIFLNKNLKPLLSCDELSSVEKVEISSQDEKELFNTNEFFEVSSSKNSSEDEKRDVEKIVCKVADDISEESNENIENTNQQQSFKSSTENTGNTKKVKVKLSPTIISYESISSLELGEGQIMEENEILLNTNEEIINVVSNDSVESSEKITESNDDILNVIKPEQKIQDNSFAILDDKKSEDYNKLNISVIEEKENQSGIVEVDRIEKTEKVKYAAESPIELVNAEETESKVEPISTDTKVESTAETESLVEPANTETKVESTIKTESVVESINAETKVEEIAKIEPQIELPFESINSETKIEETVDTKFVVEPETESLIEPVNDETKVEETVETEFIDEPVDVEIKVEEITETKSVVESVNAETKIAEAKPVEGIENTIESIVKQENENVKIDNVESAIKEQQIVNENIIELAVKPVKIVELNKEDIIEESEVENKSTTDDHGKEDKEAKVKRIEENLQAIQQSMEVDITDASPPIVHEDTKVTTNSSSSLKIRKRRESISNKNSNIYKKNKSLSHKGKKIQQSIDEEIQSISNEMNNDTIKEKFNDYVEKRSSAQSDTNSSIYSNKRASALSAYILQNENSVDEFDTSLPSKPFHSSNEDTSINDSNISKEDHTQDKLNAMASVSSSVPSSQLHDQLRSPTPTGYSLRYDCKTPTPSIESLRDHSDSPTPSEESTISNSSHSFSIGKIGRNKQFEVVYDHKPQLPDEIPLKKGDKVLIKQVFEDGWAYGIVKNKRLDGIFPIQCLGEEIEPDRNGRMVPRLVRVYQARLEDEEQKKQEEEEFKKMITDQARKNVLFKLALSHPK